jgi:hypothetical protein
LATVHAEVLALTRQKGAVYPVFITDLALHLVTLQRLKALWCKAGNLVQKFVPYIVEAIDLFNS